MDLGALEVQIFVSLVVVLGTAFVALVCDFLKGNNEQLRERNIELRVRQEEREESGGLVHPGAWLQGLASMLKQHMTTPSQAAQETAAAVQPEAVGTRRAWDPAPQTQPTEPTAQPEPAPTPYSSDAEPVEEVSHSEEPAVPSRRPLWRNEEEMERVAGLAARMRARRVDEPAQAAPEPVQAAPEPVVEAEETPASPPEKPVEVAASQPAPVAEPVPEPVFEPAPIAREEAPAIEAVPAVTALSIRGEVDSSRVKVLRIDSLTRDRGEQRQNLDLGQELRRVAELMGVHAGEPKTLEPVVEQEPVAAETTTVEEPAAFAEETPTPVAEVASAPVEIEAEEIYSAYSAFPETHAEPTREPEHLTSLRIPAGVQAPQVFAELMESPNPFTGIVALVSISETDAESGESPPKADVTATVNHLIASMLRERDFACRTREDEFVLIYPDETGASAQRRLHQVSEKLWDYQLRSMGALSIGFTSGALEVHGQPLNAAVASARERMNQNKRNRKSMRTGFSSTEKRAVNA